MYEAHWGLSTRPFENTPDPSFLYRTPQHEEALGRLLYAIEGEKGAAVLSGVFGCGKTLLSRTLLAQLDSSLYKIAIVTNPKMTITELLLEIAGKLGAQNLPTKQSEVLKNVVWDSIETLLKNNLRDGKQSIVIVDEAHAIKDPEIFEELRLLLNLQADDRFYLTLLLLGQPELKGLIEANKQLAQRIAIGYHLQPLDAAETAKYIQFRLKVGGQEKPIFTEEALKLVHSYSGGIPRRINQICDISLLTGMEQGVKKVTPEVVKEGVASLGV
ncbi:MAG: hypothetical protein A3F82_04695 [Deltaproteobacteria bacterium RIFCSPLOWO2_12_FULL_44_12]|nr:MAG: hypothetical protein A2712_05745 [Deltaproteobacteria bacterium RIFCSPHIGHO2_01_FULL_43_49]OGQ16635.1 MAG: hypothetical protein A3D22_06870 [Deltaproteobacteria bacterium RIFCSPHIGHO2_02_FULL_44_53]OGQ29773.1 MAG: hypothetical protein A3D98_09535 [Deltaproteobacteria bacterium RIFCSPHIGHO2_12_FULL_44_21]OGQ33063.1 MAG: hypothetical protein A2979_03515 [Deltaproteobacteria bacterium RIFCSPLOWO2_01_FULL_45_74]OGQ42158.1 MAG: hypothetical protein A3I70_05820 [Deltaproteobacteria bacterium 